MDVARFTPHGAIQTFPPSTDLGTARTHVEDVKSSRQTKQTLKLISVCSPDYQGPFVHLFSHLLTNLGLHGKYAMIPMQRNAVETTANMRRGTV